jgi:hypothetical protein
VWTIANRDHPDMYRVAFAVLVVAGCHKAVDTTTEPDAAVSNDGKISGTITADMTWSGAIHIVGPTTLSGTITVEPGTTIDVVQGAGVKVQRALDMNGTSAAKITITPAASGWDGFVVTGELTMHYVDMTGGGIQQNGGTVTIADTVLSHKNNSRDFLIMNGGMLDMEYSTIGPAPGTTDVIHCDFHFNPGTPNTIVVTHADISGASNGTDYYGGTNSNFTFDNWFSNTADIVTEPGTPVAGDFSNGWFNAGPPTAAPGSSFTLNNLAQAKLTDTGPRP